MLMPNILDQVESVFIFISIRENNLIMIRFTKKHYKYKDTVNDVFYRHNLLLTIKEQNEMYLWLITLEREAWFVVIDKRLLYHPKKTALLFRCRGLLILSILLLITIILIVLPSKMCKAAWVKKWKWTAGFYSFWVIESV